MTHPHINRVRLTDPTPTPSQTADTAKYAAKSSRKAHARIDEALVLIDSALRSIQSLEGQLDRLEARISGDD